MNLAVAPPAGTAVMRHRWALGGGALSVLFVALVWLASLPTGAGSPEATVGEGSRLAARATVGDVEVLVIASGGALSVQVAYPSPKGWLSARLPAAPSTAVAAWAATVGQGPIPALSVIYGRAPGASVEVEWADGERTSVRPRRDGVYVAVRNRRVASARVIVRDDDGAIVAEVDGP